VTRDSGDLSDYDDNNSGKGSDMNAPKAGSRKKKLIIKCLKEKN
jgi:hypothetical protein